MKGFTTVNFCQGWQRTEQNIILSIHAFVLWHNHFLHWKNRKKLKQNRRDLNYKLFHLFTLKKARQNHSWFYRENIIEISGVRTRTIKAQLLDLDLQLFSLFLFSRTILHAHGCCRGSSGSNKIWLKVQGVDKAGHNAELSFQLESI